MKLSYSDYDIFQIVVKLSFKFLISFLKFFVFNSILKKIFFAKYRVIRFTIQTKIHNFVYFSFEFIFNDD